MIKLLRYHFIILLCFIFSCHLDNTSSISTDKPNIIVILTDDQGFADVGFNGSKDILTPNIDKIAKNGVVFTNGYVTHPYCSCLLYTSPSPRD